MFYNSHNIASVFYRNPEFDSKTRNSGKENLAFKRMKPWAEPGSYGGALLMMVSQVGEQEKGRQSWDEGEKGQELQNTCNYFCIPKTRSYTWAGKWGQSIRCNYEIPGDRLRNKERNPKLCLKKVEKAPMSFQCILTLVSPSSTS